MYGAKERRMRRLFQADGKTFIVAMDHAGSMGVLPGLENPGKLIDSIVAGGADAILTTYGVATQFAEQIGGLGVVLRGDGGGTSLAKERGAMSLAYDALDARTKARLEGLIAIHSIFTSRARLGFSNFSAEERAALPPVPQMLVRTIPESGTWV